MINDTMQLDDFTWLLILCMPEYGLIRAYEASTGIRIRARITVGASWLR